MNLKETLTQCPKAAEKLYEFSGQALKQLQKIFAKDIPEGVESTIPDIHPDTAKSYAEVLLSTYPRVLYDFFDLQEIFISIEHFWDGKDMFGFTIRKKNGKEIFQTEDWPDRPKAEIEAFKEAFKLLEEKLNK